MSKTVKETIFSEREINKLSIHTFDGINVRMKNKMGSRDTLGKMLRKV